MVEFHGIGANFFQVLEVTLTVFLKYTLLLSPALAPRTYIYLGVSPLVKIQTRMIRRRADFGVHFVSTPLYILLHPISFHAVAHIACAFPFLLILPFMTSFWKCAMMYYNVLLYASSEFYALLAMLTT